MTRARFAIAAGVVAGAGCGTSFQSAQVLEPGKTQFIGALGRSTPDDDLTPDEGGVFHGDIQVRHGINRFFEAGVRYSGATGGHFLQLDPKFQVLSKEQASGMSISVGAPFGVYWAEEPDPDNRMLDYGGIMITPTLYIGGEVVPNQVELVGAPKFLLVFPDDGESDQEFGVSLAGRLSTDLGKWAIIPEIAYVAYGGEMNLLTFGLGLAANY